MIKMLSDDAFVNDLEKFRATRTEAYKIKENKYYGKPPKISVEIDPLTENELGYDESICLKLYLSNQNFSKEHLYLKLNENLSKAERAYRKIYPRDKEHHTLSLYINILTMISIDQSNLEKLQYLYRPVLAFPNLIKFPALYVKLLTEYNNILVNDNTKDHSLIILGNIIKISNVRQLTEIEEE
jgi:hypothetical protein